MENAAGCNEAVGCVGVGGTFLGRMCACCFAGCCCCCCCEGAFTGCGLCEGALTGCGCEGGLCEGGFAGVCFAGVCFVVAVEG